METAPSFVAVRGRNLFGDSTHHQDVYNQVVDSGQTYNIAPSGDRFVIMRSADERAVTPDIRLVLNWFAELRRR